MKRFIIFLIAVSIPDKIIALDFREQIELEFSTTLGALQQQALASGDRRLATLLSQPTVSLDWEAKLPGATARHGNGAQAVTLTAELIKLMYFFADLSIIADSVPTSVTEKILKCKTEYQEHIRNQLYHVFLGRELVSQFSTYDSPEEFAEFGKYCRGIEMFFPVVEELKPQRDMLVSNGIAFIIMHEVGHIVIGHTTSAKPDEVRQSILCSSRRQEREADEFAVVGLVRFGIPEAVTSNAYWDVSLSIALVSPRAEYASTHPSPSRRWSEAINLSVKEARRLGGKLDPRLIDLAQQAMRLQKRIEIKLADDDVRLLPVRC